VTLARDILRGKTGPQKRVAAALWRARLRAAPGSGDPLVIFAIPLISKARSADWGRVSANLAATLASLRAQTSPRWRAFVCGQDRPEGVGFEPGRIDFVPHRGRAKFYDKGDKRLALIDAAMAACAGRDGYYAQWDADDLLHPGVVAHVTGGDNLRGYLINRGYVADIEAEIFATLGPDPAEGGRPFWQACGSCSFVRCDFRAQPRHWRRLLRRMSSHTRIPEWMALTGMPLDPIDFPAAIYSFNHGENMRRRRGQDARRVAEMTARALPPARVDAVRRAFGLDRAA